MASIKQDPKTKTWTFIFSHYVKGQRKQIKRRGFPSKREANVAMIKLQNEMQNGHMPESTHHTIESFMLYWLETIRKFEIDNITYYHNTIYVKNYIIPRIGKIKLQQFNSVHAQEFVKDMAEAGYARATIELPVKLMQLALDQAKTYNMVKENNMRGVKLPKKKKYNAKVWDIDQINHFLNHTKNKRFHAAYALALLGGLRQGECLGLRFQDIDFDEKILWVRQTLSHYGTEFKDGGKTQSSVRPISLPNQLVDILIRQKIKKESLRRDLTHRLSKAELEEMDNLDLVIYNTRNGKQIFPSNIYKHFQKDVEEAKLPKIRFHDLRHSHATMLLTRKTNVKVVSERMGHSKIGVTLDTYSHVLPSVASEVADDLETIIKV